jgi:aconitate hydratase
MPMNLTRKIISAHLTKPSDMNPGDEIYVKFDQTLTHDINAVMCYLALEGMGIKRVRTDVSVSYLDHNLLYVNTNTPDDHIFLTSIARKYGIWLSRPGNGIMHSVQYARFGIPGKTSLGTDSHTTTGGAIGMLAIGGGGMDGHGWSAHPSQDAQGRPGKPDRPSAPRLLRQGRHPRDAPPLLRQGRPGPCV